MYFAVTVFIKNWFFWCEFGFFSKIRCSLNNPQFYPRANWDLYQKQQIMFLKVNWIMSLLLCLARYLKHTLLISAIHDIIKSKHFIYVVVELLQRNKRRIQTWLFWRKNVLHPQKWRRLLTLPTLKLGKPNTRSSSF